MIMVQSKQENTPNQTSGSFELTGYHVAAMVVAFFAVIISVNFTMAWFASSSWTGLVVKSSYVASQDFNKDLTASREQTARGWQMNIAYDHSELKLSITDKAGQPVLLSDARIKIGRPVSRQQDIVLNVKPLNNGISVMPVELAQGLWDFQIDAQKPQPYRIQGRIYISKDGTGRLQ